MELRDRILAEIDRREQDVAKAAAEDGNWLAATHTGRKDGISLVGRVSKRGTGEAVAVFAGTNVHQRAADAEHAALHDPADALRRYAHYRRVLDRHKPTRWPNVEDGYDAPTCAGCGRDDFGDPRYLVPCPETIDIAEALDIDPSDTTGGTDG